jgi:hypothetical protein
LADALADSVARVDADTPGDREPTEAKVQSDRLLALRTAWASLTGYAVWIHPAAGAAVTALTPIFEEIATFAVKKLGERRIETRPKPCCARRMLQASL